MTNIYDPPNASLGPPNLSSGREIKQTIFIGNWDVVAAVFYSSLRNKFMWALSLFTVGIWHAIGFIGLWALGFPAEETAMHSFSLLFWLMFVFIISTILGAGSLLINPRWRKGRLGKHTITITDTHLTEETDFNKTQISWDSIEKLSKGRSKFYITHSGTEVFPISSKCFQDQAAWEEFYEILKDRYDRQKYA